MMSGGSREGVYSSHLLGPPGKRVPSSCWMPVTFRSPLKKGFQVGEPGDGFRGLYVPNTDPGVTVLGEPQWKWLADQLKVPAEVRVIASGVQVVPDEHGRRSGGNFPADGPGCSA